MDRTSKKDLKGHKGEDGTKEEGGNENEIRTKQSPSYQYPFKEKGLSAKRVSSISVFHVRHKNHTPIFPEVSLQVCTRTKARSHTTLTAS